MTIRAPGDTHRTIVLGRTGTGKSQWAIDQLADQNWDKMPWVMIDFKGDDLLELILEDNKGKIKEIKVTDNPPKRPGLYYMKPAPVLDDKLLEEFLMKVWRQGNVGLYIDEGYALPEMGKTTGFTLILTQGRSLHIPCIYLYQRPVWMSRFAVAQSDFRVIFKQDDDRDEMMIKSFVPPAILPDGTKLGPLDLDKLPDYYSLYRDVGRGKTVILRPAPSQEVIRKKYRSRLNSKRYSSQKVLV